LLHWLHQLLPIAPMAAVDMVHAVAMTNAHAILELIALFQHGLRLIALLELVL